MTISATGFGSMDGFNVKTSADANGTHAGDTTENIKNGKTVDMQELVKLGCYSIQ